VFNDASESEHCSTTHTVVNLTVRRFVPNTADSAYSGSCMQIINVICEQNTNVAVTQRSRVSKETKKELLKPFLVYHQNDEDDDSDDDKNTDNNSNSDADRLYQT